MFRAAALVIAALIAAVPASAQEWPSKPVRFIVPFPPGGSVDPLALPEVPTLIEQGFPGLTAYAWWGIYAPAGTPKPIIDRFHAELTNVLSQPDVRKTLAEGLGMDLNVSTPEALQKWTLEQLAHWGRVVKDGGIKTD